MKGVAAGYGPFYGCSNVHCGTYGRYQSLEQWQTRAPSQAERELRECLEEMIRIYSCGATSMEMCKLAQKELAKKGTI
jgi:hypothetical protein